MGSLTVGRMRPFEDAADQIVLAMEVATVRRTGPDAPPQLLELVADLVMGRPVLRSDLHRWGVTAVAGSAVLEERVDCGQAELFPVGR